MKRIRYLANGAFAWPIFLGVSLACFVALSVVTLLAWPFDRHLGARLGGRVWGPVVYGAMPNWTLHRTGFDRPLQPPCVIVSNHASVLDIPALMHLPIPFRVVAKHSLFQIPFLGWFMSLSGQIPADMGLDGQTADRCLRELQAGRSVLMFPEGTRSADGRVARFRRGAFQIAREAGVPVLVCGVEGTRHILGKGQLLPRKFWVDIHAGVLAVLRPQDHDDARQMARAAREAVSAQIGAWQALEASP